MMATITASHDNKPHVASDNTTNIVTENKDTTNRNDPTTLSFHSLFRNCTPLPTNHPNLTIQNESVDLTSNDYKIDDLNILHFSSINSNFTKENTIVFNLANNSNFSNENLTIIDLNLPTTLIRRTSFDFIKLLKIKLLNNLPSFIHSIKCSTNFIFFDNISKLKNCQLATFYFISKFKKYIDMNTTNEDKFSLFLLEYDEKESSDTSSPFLSNSSTPSLKKPEGVKTPNKLKRKFNFKLNLSSLDNSKPSKIDNEKLFLDSFKKDSIHYSPNSLKKYFKFKIPPNIDTNDSFLPTWLDYFSNDTNGDLILQKLLSNFELLEKFEIKRLKNCVTNCNCDYTNPQDNANQMNKSDLHIQYSNDQHKIYSLSYLQKQFKRAQKKRINNDNLKIKKDLKISIPNAKLLLPSIPFNSENTSNSAYSDDLSPNGSNPVSPINGNNLSLPSLNKKQSNPNYSPLGGDSDSSLLTPLNSYEINEGIRAFSKNRYSNIVPYEHTRVKLQPSPSISAVSNNNSNYSLVSPSTSNLQCDQPKLNDEIRTPPELLNNLASSYFSNSDIQRFNSETSSCANPCSNDKLKDDYFNANYLNLNKINPDFSYIATQAPLPTTMDDFWKVVMSNEIKVIVSINSYDELNMRKWDIYWSPQCTRRYSIRILNVFEDVLNTEGCIIRIFEVSRAHASMPVKPSIIYQIHYTKWLDSCCIDMNDILILFKVKNLLMRYPNIFFSILTNTRETTPDSSTIRFDELFYKTLKTVENESQALDNDLNVGELPPILVHCSAGCGRTGVFITLDFLLNIFQTDNNNDTSNKIDVWNMKQDLIFIIVNELRKQRLSMVQNLSQYITCYESILEYFSLLKKQVTKDSKI